MTLVSIWRMLCIYSLVLILFVANSSSRRRHVLSRRVLDGIINVPLRRNIPQYKHDLIGKRSLSSSQLLRDRPAKLEYFADFADVVGIPGADAAAGAVAFDKPRNSNKWGLSDEKEGELESNNVLEGDIDASSDLGLDKRFEHAFVGKRGLELANALDGQEPNYGDLLAKRFSHAFVGKRFNHAFVGKRFNHAFVGKRFNHAFVGKRFNHAFVGKRFNHAFVGKRFNHAFVGKRFNHAFVGKRFSHAFVGKRAPVSEFEDGDFSNEKRFSHSFVGKRAPSFVGKRFSHSFVGKRDPAFDNSLLEKRFSHSFVGKRGYEHGFVGKRDIGENIEDPSLVREAIEPSELSSS